MMVYHNPDGPALFHRLGIWYTYNICQHDFNIGEWWRDATLYKAGYSEYTRSMQLHLPTLRLASLRSWV